MNNMFKKQLLYLTIMCLIHCFFVSLSFAKEESSSNGGELNSTSYDFLSKQVQNFIALRTKYPQLYKTLEAQLPNNATLIEVFVPSFYKRHLKQEQFHDITHFIYLYTMPFFLSDDENTSKKQFDEILGNYEKMLEDFVLFGMENTNDDQVFKEKIKQHTSMGKSIYFQTQEEKNTQHYTMLHNVQANEEQAMQAFLSTHIFIQDSQIYFLTASIISNDEAYFKELSWVKNNLKSIKPNATKGAK